MSASKGKRNSIRTRAIVSAARKTANTKLTIAKIAALRQSRIFNISQSPINLNKLQRKKTTRILHEHSPGHTKPFIIAASSSAADFMITTPSRSTVSTIAPLRNIRKSQAEATVKKLNVEQTIANIPQSTATKETTIIDLVDTSDEPQPTPTLTVNPNSSSFGQDIVILSSDSQESIPSFHIASIHSVPTRTFDPPKPTPMDCSPPIPNPERTQTNTSQGKLPQTMMHSTPQSASHPPAGGMW